jgi:mono/diheme cytochrome c family protein
MVLRFFAIGILLFLASCGSGEVKSIENTEDVASVEPKSLYILHCEACHGLDGKKGSSGAANLAISKFSDAEIKNVISNGNEKGMMPYKDIITNEKDLNGLVEFVKTLRK